MATFSLNIGTDYEATSYPLVSEYDIQNILDTLIDNESKLITPVKLRDSILSLYSSSAFKLTSSTNSSIVSEREYIGIDTLNNEQRDLKRIIYFGKRSFSGTFSYSGSHDIMSTFSFSSNNTDIYFFNTKRDTIVNDETKISLLSGTNFNLHKNAPYIKSKIISSTTSLSLDLVNTSSNASINLTSDYGTVSINGINFPTIIDSTNDAFNRKTLKWLDNKVVWDDIEYEQTSIIGTSSENMDIYGDPFYINGFPLSLTDNRSIPIPFTDIVVGKTFSNVPISEILKSMIYTYLPPLCSIEILPPYNFGISEVGTYPTPIIKYTVTKRTLPTNAATLTNMIPGIFASISDEGLTKKTGLSNAVVITPINTNVTTFQISVNDGTQSVSASASIQGIYPYFYGFSNLSSITTIGLLSLTKAVERKSDKYISLSGDGNLYFIYDYSYGTLSNIYDSYGNIVSASFSYEVKVLSSPTGLWASKQFYVYKWSNTSQVEQIPYNLIFEY